MSIEGAESKEKSSFSLDHLKSGDILTLETVNSVYVFEVRVDEDGAISIGKGNFYFPFAKGSSIKLGEELKSQFSGISKILSVISKSEIKDDFNLREVLKGDQITYSYALAPSHSNTETRNETIKILVDAAACHNNAELDEALITLHEVSSNTIRYQYDGYQNEPIVKEIEIQSPCHLRTLSLSEEKKEQLKNRESLAKTLK